MFTLARYLFPIVSRVFLIAISIDIPLSFRKLAGDSGGNKSSNTETEGTVGKLEIIVETSFIIHHNTVIPSAYFFT